MKAPATTSSEHPSVRFLRPRSSRLFAFVVAAVLTIGGSAGAATRTEEKTHVVVQGQTLKGIAKRFKITVDELRDANDLTPGSRLKVGTRLVIPVAGSGGGKRERGSKDEVDEDEKPKKRDRRERDEKSDREEKSDRDEKTDREDKAERGKRSKRGKDDDEKDGKAKKAGYVRLVHDDEEWEGVVVDKKGRVTPAAKTAFAKLLRPEAGGKSHPIDPRLIKAIVEVSDHFGGKTLEIVSGFRPQTKSQHTPHSKHNKGSAMDFHVAGVSNAELRDFCKGLGDVGVGYYPRSSFVHLDVRDTSAFWVDSSGPGEAPRYEASR